MDRLVNKLERRGSLHKTICSEMKKLLQVVFLVLTFVAFAVVCVPKTVEAAGEVVTTVKYNDVSDTEKFFKFQYTGNWHDANGLYMSPNAESSVKLKFNGTKFDINMFKATDSGIMDVYIDGNKVDSVSLVSANDDNFASEVVYESPVLSPGEHEVSLVNSPLSDGSYGYLYMDGVSITRSPVAATDIVSDEKQLTLEETDVKQLTIAKVPEYADDTVTYKSMDESVASVTATGEVHAKRAGQTEIIVSVPNKQIKIPVTVTKLERNLEAFVGSKDRHYKSSQYKEIRNDMQANTTTPFAWKGDEVNGEVVILSKNTPINNVTVTVSDFTSGSNTIANSNVKVYFLKETSAYIGRGFSHGNIPEGPNEMVPDILDNVTSVNISANGVQPVWLKILVPADARPGLYKGTITIQGENGLQPITLPYEFNVLDAKQPTDNKFSLELWQYPYTTARYYNIKPEDMFGPEHMAILKQELSEYIKAGGQSITTTIVEDPWNHQTYDKYPSMVNWRRSKDAVFSFDFTNFDKYVQLALDLGINKQIKAFSMTPWENRVWYFSEAANKFGNVKLEPGSEKWNNIWGQFLKAFVAHLDEKGWFDITYLAMDERPISTMQPVIDLVDTYRNKDGKKIKISAAMNYSAEKADILEKIDDISIDLSAIDHENTIIRDLAESRRQKGQTTTIYTPTGVYPNSFTRSAPVETAWTLWYAQSMGVDGFLRWAYDAWVEDPLTSVNHWWWESGDPFFVYPADKDATDKTPRTSPRFEQLKEAKRNIEKIRFIKAVVPESVKEIDDFVATLGRSYGQKNAYGAMQSTGVDQDKFIASEVARMNQFIFELTKKYASVLGEEMVDVVLPKEEPTTSTEPAVEPTEKPEEDNNTTTTVSEVPAEKGSNATITENSVEKNKQELPHTGIQKNNEVIGFAIISLLAGFVLINKSFTKEQ